MLVEAESTICSSAAKPRFRPRATASTRAISPSGWQTSSRRKAAVSDARGSRQLFGRHRIAGADDVSRVRHPRVRSLVPGAGRAPGPDHPRGVRPRFARAELSRELLHLILESLKAAFADRERYYGDPNFVDVPIEGLLDPAYAAAWRERIDRADRGGGNAGSRRSLGIHGAPTSRTAAPYDPPCASRGAARPDTSYLCVDRRAGQCLFGDTERWR